MKISPINVNFTAKSKKNLTENYVLNYTSENLQHNDISLDNDYRIRHLILKDKDKKIVRRYNFLKKDQVNPSSVDEYNNNGVLILRSKLYPKSRIVHTIETRNPKSGCKTSIITYNPDNTRSYSTHYSPKTGEFLYLKIYDYYGNVVKKYPDKK